MYAIIARWDDQKRVSRYNYVETEVEAVAIVDRLRGVGDNPLPVNKQCPDAYYTLMPPAPTGTASMQHRARFWIADPDNKAVIFDVAACHAWQSKVTGKNVDIECDRRVDEMISPGSPYRATRIRAEMPEGPKKEVLINKVNALRKAAKTLQDSLINKTPEEMLNIKPTDDIHWRELL